MSAQLGCNEYAQIIQHAPDAVLFSDREGIIRLWNDGAEHIFGFSAAEAVGQSLDLIIPERLRQRHGMVTTGLWKAENPAMASMIFSRYRRRGRMTRNFRVHFP